MKVQILVVVAFAIIAYAEAAIFNITNKGNSEIWIGIQENSGKQPLAKGGFKLARGANQSINATDDWAGKIWSRTWCSADKNNTHCLTGDCGNKIECAGAGPLPPATVIEIALTNSSAGLDWYDISVVNGFNNVVSIEPVDGQGHNSYYSCKKAECATQINSICPVELQVKNVDKTQVIGCKSACDTFKTEQFCCTGAYDSLENCTSSNWHTDYPAIFKKACPDAFSFAYDDYASIFSCNADAYNINFGAV